MSKASWEASNPKKSNLYHNVWLLLILVLVAACTASDGTESPVPTQTLIPSTATFTPLPPPTVTPTREPALRPEDLVTNTPDYLNTIPAEAHDIVAQVADDLLAMADIDANTLTVAYFNEQTWREDEILCSDEPSSLRRVEGYHIVFLTGNMLYEYRTNGRGFAQQCAESTLDDAPAELLVLVDFVAAEMARSARLRVADVEDVAVNRVELIDIKPIQWPDTGLGCPAEGQTYAAVQVDGYRIVVAYQGEETIFHTDFERLLRCAPEDEVLPE